MEGRKGNRLFLSVVYVECLAVHVHAHVLHAVPVRPRIVCMPSTRIVIVKFGCPSSSSEEHEKRSESPSEVAQVTIVFGSEHA